MIKEIQSRIEQPDHPFWKRVGNFAVIVAGPIGTLAILIFVPVAYKDASVAAWAALVAAIKAGTKLTTK